MSSSKTSQLIFPGILLGVILGALLGYFVSDFMLAVSIIGELYFNTLLIIALPLVLAAVIAGVTALGDYRKLGRVGGKTLWYFLVTGLGAVVLAMVASLINFGGEMSQAGNFLSDFTGANSPYLNYTNLMKAGDFSLFGGLLNNIQYLSLVLLAIVFGGVLSTFGPRKIKNVISFFKEMNEALLKLFEFFLYLAPLGLLSLVGTSVALARGNLPEMFSALGVYLLVLLGTFLVYGLVILPVIYKVVTSRSPFQFLNGMLPAVFTAFATGSSTASLAVTYHGAVERNRVDQRAGSLVLSLGTVFNVSATAMWLVISIMALVQFAPGADLSTAQVISVAVLSLLISIGLVGVPRLTKAVVLIIISLSGLPEVILAGTAVLLPAEWLTDRLRAVLNVWGDAVGAAVISETLEFKAVGRKAAAVSTREPKSRTPRKGRQASRADTRKTGGRERTKPSRGGSSQGQKKDTRPPRRSDRTEKSGPITGGDRSPDPRRNGFKAPVKSKSSPFEISDSALPELEPDFESQEQKKNGREKVTPARNTRNDNRPSRSSSPRSSSQRPHSDRNRAPRPAPTPAKEVEERTPEKKPKEDILDNAMFKKELARVSAHLHAIEKEKRVDEPSKSEPKSIPVEDKPVEASDKAAPVSYDEPVAEPVEKTPVETPERDKAEVVEEKTEPSITPEMNFFDRLNMEEKKDDGPTEVASGDVEKEDADETEDDVSPAPAEPETPAVMEYGRSRYKKGAKPKPENASSKPTESKENIPEPEDSFSKENITFGRTKKKRTR